MRNSASSSSVYLSYSCRNRSKVHPLIVHLSCCACVSPYPAHWDTPSRPPPCFSPRLLPVVLSLCPVESPVGESQVPSRKSPVVSHKSCLKHGAGRSVVTKVDGTEFSGLHQTLAPRRFVAGFHLCPVGPLPDPLGTAPGRYRTLPARLTSSPAHLAGANRPLSLLSAGNARPRIERGEDTSHGT